MNCQEFRQNLSLYIDDALEPSQDVRLFCDEHLRGCPLCRSELAEMQVLHRGLQSLARHDIPADLMNAVRRSVSIEVAAQKPASKSAFGRSGWDNWFEFRFMPYTVGTLASVLLFAMMFAALRTAMTTFREFQEQGIARTRQQTGNNLVIASHLIQKQYDSAPVFSAADYAALRSPYALESPSLNPKGAFVAFTNSLARGEMDDEGMVVVAEVFSNGIAKVSDVLNAPHDKQTLDELNRILKSEPAFVPAAYDNRPENMRVVLLIQKVEVHDETTRIEPLKTRKF